MPIVAAGHFRFDVDAVVLDKDGTLVDFDQLWAGRTARWFETLAALAGRPEIAGTLGELHGYDPARRHVLEDSPLAIGSTADIYAIAAGVLFQHGWPWHEGRPLVLRSAATTVAAPPEPAEVLPIGNVAGSVRRLRASGLSIAVATNDDRALTEATLEHLGIAGEVARLACGDDDFPPKPDPAGLRWLAAELGTSPERLVVVGDSANDMLYARNGGAAGIGIVGGAGAHDSLAKLADVLVKSIDELLVVG